MPILLQEEATFAGLYGETGRPNWSVARMLGLLILQGMTDTHDQEALDLLSFDSRWQHALDLPPEDAYLSRRSLVKFRARLVEADPEMALMRRVFERIGARAIEKLGVSIKQQRIDSTHVTSNIRTKGRLELFATTLTLFLKVLSNADASNLEKLPTEMRAWFANRIDDDSWEHGSEDRKRDVQQLADWMWLVKRTFDDAPIADTESFRLIERLLAEHCDVAVDDVDAPESGTDDEGGSDQGGGGSTPSGGGTIRLRRQGKGSGTSLQSPHDPDAGYSHKKGVGYSVQIVETCGNHPDGKGPPEILTDFHVHSAGMRDFGQTLPALKRLTNAERCPERLYGDSHYTSGESILVTGAMGVDLHSPAGRGRLPADMVGREQFTFDEDGKLVACPMGHAPVDHMERTTSKERKQTPHAKLDRSNCETCSLRGRCVARPPNSKKGHWHVDIGADLRARDANLAAQQTEVWSKAYSIRSGIEATNSELKRSHGMRHLRVRRQPRVTLEVVMKLTGCNIKRWLRPR